MQASLKATFNNSYYMELIDSATGSVKKSGTFHNIATVDMLGSLTGAYYNSEGKPSGGMAGILSAIKVGSGVDEPSFAQRALSTPLWSARVSSPTFEWLDDYTGRGTGVYTFPATASYVGNITEVGLYSPSYYRSGGYGSILESATQNVEWVYRMCTRALLTDSEGQQISFNKTDLDILKITVTVELSFSSTDSSFKIFKKPYFLRNVLMGQQLNDEYFTSIYGSPRLYRFHNDLDFVQLYYPNPPSGQSGRIDFWTSADLAVSVTPKSFYNSNGGYIKYPVTRVGADTISSDRYFKAYVLPSLGYWKLPNEEVLPTYKILNIPVGTGDGSTVSFINPLNYFKKDSEVVYKNGMPLTRGIDYVLNNAGNKDCIPELADIYGIPKVTSAAVTNTTLAVRPLVIPSAISALNLGWPKIVFGEDIALCFSGTNPLYIEYDEEVTMNCFKCTGGLRSMSGTNGLNNIPAGTMFYLDYSQDGETYVECGSTSLAEVNGAFNIDFESTKAKFWRLRTNYSNLVSIYDSSHYMTLNYKDPYITFTTPPADGDVITMEVGMDLIFKNSNFVIDVGCQIDFNI